MTKSKKTRASKKKPTPAEQRARRLEMVEALGEAAVNAIRATLAASPQQEAGSLADAALSAMGRLMKPAVIAASGRPEKPLSPSRIFASLVGEGTIEVLEAVTHGTPEERSEVYEVLASMTPLWLRIIVLAAGDNEAAGAQFLREELAPCLEPLLRGLALDREAREELERDPRMAAALQRALACGCCA